MSFESTKWFLSVALAVLPLFSVFPQITNSLYDSANTYREVTSSTDGCPTADHLCHYHPGMNLWGDDTPAKEYNYRGFNGSNVVEFMNWRMLFPVGYKWDHSAKYPMIIMLHGSGESGRIGSCCFGIYSPSDERYDNNDDNLHHGGREHQVATGYSTVTGLPSGPVKFPGIVIWPQSSYNGSWEGGWNNGALADDSRMATKILEWIITHYDVDPDRIVVHGLSSGGRGTWDLAAKRPDLFAAILPMSGVASNYDVQTDILVTTPVWLFQGGIDTNPNPGASKTLIDLLNSKGGNGTRTVYPDLGHSTWQAAYAEPNFFPFILAANKKNIYVFGGDPGICPGGLLKLGFSAGYTAYQWTLNGNNIAGANSRFYNASAPGDYAVKFTRVTDGSIGTSYTLRVNAKTGSSFVPVITNTGSPYLTIDLAGTSNTVTLTAPAGYASYSWLKNHSVVASTSTNTRIISVGTGAAADAGTYTATVLPATGCTSQESNPITVFWNASQPASPKPNFPTFVKISPTALQLDWNSMPSEIGFEVWRQQFATTGPPAYASKGYVSVASLPAGTSSYTDQGVRPLGQYRYRVRAIHSGNSATFSNDSPDVSMAPDVTPPVAPNGLAADDISETQITFHWSHSADNDVVYKYEVYNGSTLFTTLTGGAEGNPLPPNSVVVSGLTPNVSYTFKVRAIDYSGNYSPFSDPLTVTPTYRNGLRFKYYTFPGTLPSTNALAEPGGFNFAQTPAQTGTVATFDISGAYTFQGGSPAAKTDPPNNFVYAFDGLIQINSPGTYRFYTNSDDGSRLYINGSLLVNNDGSHGPITVSAPISIATAGKYPIRVTFYEQTHGESLIVKYSPGSPDNYATATVIPNSVLFLPAGTPSNAPPTVSAGADQSVSLPLNQLQLTGTASDSDGTIAGYSWTKISGPSVTMTNDQTSTLTLTNISSGMYTFQLIATDNGGATASDQVAVTVSGGGTQAREFDVNLTWAWNKAGVPWNDFVTTGGGVVGNSMALKDINSAASSITISVSASFVDGANNHGVKPGVYPNDVMQYYLRSSTTTQGALKLSGLNVNSTYALSVLCSNADVWYPSDTKLSVAGQTATINAKGNSSVLVNFSSLVPNAGGELILSVAPATTASTNVGVINALVIKESQAGGGNVPPVVNAGPDAQVDLPLAQWQRTGTATDQDGTITSMQWTKISGPAATLTDSGNGLLTLTNILAGTYVLKFAGRDNSNVTVTDEMTLIVNPAPATAVREFDINLTWTWNKQAALPWNDFITTNGGIVGNTMTLVDKNGNSSTVSIAVTAPFVDGANNHGVNPGLYPTNVMKYFLRSTTTAGALKLAGLNSSKQYDLSIMSSNVDSWYPSDTRLTVQGQSATVNAKGNVNQLVNFVNVVPSGPGEIAITVAPATAISNNIGVINAIVLTEHENSNPGARMIEEPVGEPALDNLVHVFPNSIDDYVTVEIMASQPTSEVYSIDFSDMYGKRIYHLELEASGGDRISERIAADFMQTGIYIVSVRSRQNGVRYLKVLKK